MRLIGMLDSPYVRRVAISMRLLGIAFEHRSLSVFRDFEAFRAINPLVKVPTLVLDDGTILVESSLILDHIDELAEAGRSLMPQDPRARLECRRLMGIGTVALDKSISLVYERTQRPERLQHPGWIERSRLQVQSACLLLEQAVEGVPGWLFADEPLQADLTLAVAWTFINRRIAQDIHVEAYPALNNFTRRAEQHPAFQRYPFPPD